VENDPFLNFISDLSNKIKVEKEHKQLIENINNSDTIDENKGSLETLILKIKEKINNIPSAEVKEIKPELSVSEIIKKDLETVVIETNEEKEADFGDFVSKLKDILSNKEKLKPSVLPEEKKNTSTIKETASGNKIDYKEEIQKAIKSKSIKVEKNKEQTSSYVKELDNIKANVISETENSKVTEIKKLIEEYADKYIKKALVMSEYAGGGGTNAVQFANGGTMNGNLNVTGNYLSGGVNLLDIFGTGGTGSVNKILPGNNIAISPTVGTGTVTINSTTINYLTANRVAISAVDITSNLSVGFVNIDSTAPGTSDLSGIYRLTNEYSFGYPIYRNINGNGSRIERSGGPNAWYIFNSNNNNVYFNTTTGTPWEGVWITIPGRPSPPPSVTVFDPFINSLGTISVAGQGNSKQWNSTYTTVQSYSGTWSTGIQTLAFNENNYDLSITNGNTVNLSALKDNFSELVAASGSWNSNYTTVSQNSAYWADTRYDVTFGQNVTINGNLTALGTSTFKNTIFTTTSALSVVNYGPGPALYVFQAAGPYDVASFYDGDGVEVLHVGNANVGQGGKVGINESNPSVELTVNGQISANNVITALGGNSNQWNNSYSNLVANSAIYLGIENVKNLSDSELSLDLNQFTIYTKRVSSENVFTYNNFVSGRTLTVYLSASHSGVVGHYFPVKTYFGSNGTSNIVYTFSGFATKVIIQNVGDYFMGSTFLIPINVQQYPKVGDYMLMETFGFILQEDDYRIILD